MKYVFIWPIRRSILTLRCELILGVHPRASYVAEAMWSAFFRLIVITFASLGFIGIVLMGVRWLGLNASHVSVDHPLNKTPYFIVANSGGAEVGPPHTTIAYDHIAQTSNKIWLEANLRITKDRHWVVFGEEFVEKLTEGSGRVLEHNLDELKKLNLGHHYQNSNGEFTYRDQPLQVMTVEEFLDRYPKHKIILDLHEKAPGAAERLAEILVEKNAGERVILFSRIPFNTEVIRAKAPLWLYGEPTTHLARLNVLASLFIETVATIKGDVLFVPMMNGSEARARKNLVKEFLRRKRLIILDGTSLKAARESWIFPSSFGFMTLRPVEAFQQLIENQRDGN